MHRGGNKDERERIQQEREWKRQEKEEAYQAQLDVLKRRKSGAWQKVTSRAPKKKCTSSYVLSKSHRAPHYTPGTAEYGKEANL